MHTTQITATGKAKSEPIQHYTDRSRNNVNKNSIEMERQFLLRTVETKFDCYNQHIKSKAVRGHVKGPWETKGTKGHPQEPKIKDE